MERNQVALKLSNESLQTQKEKDDTFIKDLGEQAIKKMQDAQKLARDFDAISRKYRNQQTVPIDKEGILNEKLRQELRKDISTPLPFPTADGM